MGGKYRDVAFLFFALLAGCETQNQDYDYWCFQHGHFSAGTFTGFIENQRSISPLDTVWTDSMHNRVKKDGLCLTINRTDAPYVPYTFDGSWGMSRKNASEY